MHMHSAAVDHLTRLAPRTRQSIAICTMERLVKVLLAVTLLWLATGRSPPAEAFSIPGALLNSVPAKFLESCINKLFASGRRSDAADSKPYSAMRVRNDSQLQVRWFDQTVAVVELSADWTLLGCEFIEMRCVDR